LELCFRRRSPLAERGLRRLGCEKVNLQVRATNSAVVAFYRSLGYVVEERVSMGRRLEGLANQELQTDETRSGGFEVDHDESSDV
jgi:ribosomal protein S18 acetylase RimI-like enzyme